MKEVSYSLQRRAHPLADPAQQLETLSSLPLPSFEQTLSRADQTLTRQAISSLQVNLGRRCNQVCRHCHVDAGPDRRETMSDEVLEASVALLAAQPIPLLDITGGAPELHPRFRWLVEQAHRLGRRIIDRCNLTILTTDPFAELPAFLADHRVEVVASLPAFSMRNTDLQRGEGVFDQSIEALKRLNAVGYGMEGTGLQLTLVSNPVGAFLPASQQALEREWKRELARRYGVHFNQLFTLANMPIARYLEFLSQSGNLETYMSRLHQAFNPATVEGLMCRYTLSVSWDGRLFDCDFNQMLDLPLQATIFDLRPETLVGASIQTAAHCYGCTAGAGSSCGGAVEV